MLNALNAGKSQRTLFSPAECLNGLTIGAAHSGSAFNGALPANAIDPFTSGELPNIVSAMGLGYRKAVKPDILLDGGRAPVRFVAGGQQLVVTPVTAGARFFGLKAASPAALGGTRHEDFTWGTSVATALATRAGHKIHDVLLDAVNGSNHSDLPPEYMALVLKALLVHDWFSPINSRHQGYRMAALDVSSAAEEKYWIASDRPCQPTDKATARGTIFHERRSGESATVFLDDGHVLLRISCRSAAGDLEENIPYALAVSFEVAVDAGIQVYEQIRARLAAPVQAVVSGD
jgi:hypothetical protein